MNPADHTELDARLHAYADDRLDPTARAQMEAWLREHPEEAARVQAWRRDNAALRTAWAWTDAMPVTPRWIRRACAGAG